MHLRVIDVEVDVTLLVSKFRDSKTHKSHKLREAAPHIVVVMSTWTYYLGILLENLEFLTFCLVSRNFRSVLILFCGLTSMLG